ncbi:neutral amino acid transporter [Kluyveromyces marxianus]|nr:neutral amino acid transporter [Kluyveromyces marxianus]
MSFSTSARRDTGATATDLSRWNDSPVGSVGSHHLAGQRRRSMSFSESIQSSARTGQNPLDMSAQEMRGPNGFRRSFIQHKSLKLHGRRANFLTRNFNEFLSLYGHFAGEDLSEEEEEEGQEQDQEDEESALLHVIRHEYTRQQLNRGDDSASVAIEDDEYGPETSATTGPHHKVKKKTSTTKAVLLLLKSFVGTGVLFLPRAFHNGGWLFSTVCLFFCAIVSFYCFMLLIDTKTKVGVDGYGELGARLFGPKLKFTVLSSIVLSQIGFAAAYTVFTATNLQAFCKHVFRLEYSLVFWIMVQLVFYLPLSLTRNIAKLSATALLADVFILLGLVYVYYYSSYYIFQHHGIASDTMLMFNKSDWTLFIGTAIFTYEGIGLLIPIHESMEHPNQFKPALLYVILLVTVIFVSCGLVCYAAFGDKVETVILLNFPSDSIFTNSVQLIYALAILLSTPLQLFPAIKILENKLFNKNASGKHNPRVKWHKNYFRSVVVLVTVLIAWLGANDLDKFVSLIGSFACIPLIYIYPPLFHFKVHEHDRALQAVDLAILLFGGAVMAYTSYQTVSLWMG